MVNSKAMGTNLQGATAIDITDDRLAIRFRKERLAHLTAEISRAQDQKYILECELEAMRRRMYEASRKDEYPHETLIRLSRSPLACLIIAGFLIAGACYIFTLDTNSLGDEIMYAVLAGICLVYSIIWMLAAAARYFAKYEWSEDP